MYNNQLWEPVETFTYTGSLQMFTLQPDTYLFVANGARGGKQPTADNRNDFISWGATTYGILDLDHVQTFYAAVGGDGSDSKGTTTPTKGGYNGGGNGGASASTSYIAGAAGGGGTDVRLSGVENTREDTPSGIPHGYDQVEFLSSLTGEPGTTCAYGNIINTGYIIKPTSKIELVIETYPDDAHGSGTANLFAGPVFGACSDGDSFPEGKATAFLDDEKESKGAEIYINEDYRSVSSDENDVEIRSEEWWDIHNNKYWYGQGKVKFTLEDSDLSYETENGNIAYTLHCIDSTTRQPSQRITCEYPMYIFSVNCGGHPVYKSWGFQHGIPEIAHMRFYYMKIWENGALVHWYVPIALSNDDGLTEYTDYTDAQKNMMRNRGLFDIIEQKSYFGIIKEPKDWYGMGDFICFGIGPHVAPIDQDILSSSTVEKINGAPSRILVAGGGGGSSVMFNANNTQNFYSFGGGVMSGAIIGPNITSDNNAGLRATQNSGYSFGVGACAENKANSPTSGVTYGNTGIGGGGGGWYGGYSIIGKASTTEAYTAYGGTGGSSYILTANSYKPEGYMKDFIDIMPTLYFRNGLMLPYQAFDGPSVEIYKVATVAPLAGDKIVIPFTGTWQGTTLVPSKYKLKCYGGDGATSINTRSASKGGYAEGVLTLQERTPLFFHVGSSQYIYATECNTTTERNTIFQNTSGFQAWVQTSYSYTVSAAFSSGGSVDVRTVSLNDDSVNSKYSRIIVAGGGGGGGYLVGIGGNGGGLEGGNYTGDTTHATPKPGTQNSGFAFEAGAKGGHATVGSGSSMKTIYLGGGGYGWYGGHSPLNEGALSDSGGSGGSGYVLTSSSYKPAGYIPDSKFWLTDTVLTQGGNPIRGMTRIVVEVLENSSEGGSLTVIAGDGEYFKAYDKSTNSWTAILDVSELTQQVFEDHGVQLDAIISDEGLSFPYKLYVYDPFDIGVNKIYSYVVPNQQRITFSTKCDVKRVRKYIIDGEFDNNVTVALNYELTDKAINSELLLDMSDVIEKDSFVCMIQYRVTKNSSTEFKHTELNKSGEEVLLYSTLTDKRIPAENKEYPYPYPYMADRQTLISSITNACACIHNRKVYVATLLNDTSIRVNSYDMTTNECDMIIDDVAKGPLSSGGGTGGSLLAGENGLYLGNSFMNGTSDVIILHIPYDGSSTVRYRSKDAISDNEKGRRNAYGQMYWYSPTKILSCTMNGFLLFDTTTGSFTQVLDDVNGDQLPVNSFAMGDYTILECLYDEGGTTTVRVFNKETLTAVTGYNVTFPSGTRCVSFSDGKFYIAQPGHLYIFEDNNTCKPTLVSDIPIPDDTLQPKTVDQTEGCIYITFSVSNVMYVYSTKEQTWTDITLPFTNPDYYKTGWHRPATFKGYIYLGDMELFVTNASMYNKYRIGERNSYVHAIINSESAPHMTYDNRFITVDEVGAHIHAGYLDKTLSPIASGSKIKESQDYLATDYNRLINHSFRKGK